MQNCKAMYCQFEKSLRWNGQVTAQAVFGPKLYVRQLFKKLLCLGTTIISKKILSAFASKSTT